MPINARGGDMKLPRMMGALCAVLTVAACAATQPTGQNIELPPKRLLQEGFSLIPLNEEGWVINRRTSNLVILGKYGKNPDQTFAVSAGLIKLPPFKTNEEFVRLVKEGQSQDTDPKRFTTIKHEVTSYPKNGAECARSHWVAVDHAAAKRSGQPGDMNFETLTLLCAHPKDKKIGLNVFYSQRSYPGQEDPAFLEKASTVLNSVELTDPYAK
jgi:hypothetical protein